MDTNKIDKAEKASGFLSGLLTGWGLPANWARIIAGAVIGAIAAYFAATSTGCTFSQTKSTSPDGASTSATSAELRPVDLSAFFNKKKTDDK